MLDSLFASAGGGAITGVIGTAVSSVFQLMNAKNELRKKELEYAHEVKLQEMQLSVAREETERELQVAAMAAESAQITESYKHDISLNDEGVWNWVKSVRALMRPLLTLVIVGADIAICFLLLLGTAYLSFGDAQVAAMLETHINQISYLASTIVVWWFGGREARKRVGK